MIRTYKVVYTIFNGDCILTKLWTDAEALFIYAFCYIDTDNLRSLAIYGIEPV